MLRAGLGRRSLLSLRSGGAGDYVPPEADVTAPTITSSNAINLAEGDALSHALTADEAVTWSKVGGADQALFTLTGSTLGLAAQDYETPADADANNTYVVTVRATDAASNTRDQTITVTVTDVSEGGGPTYGSELVTNGTFDTDTTGWTLGANMSWAVVSGELVQTKTNSTNASGRQNISGINANRVHRFRSTGRRPTAATAKVGLFHTSAGVEVYEFILPGVSNASIDMEVVIEGTDCSIFTSFTGTVGQEAVYDNISLLERTDIGALGPELVTNGDGTNTTGWTTTNCTLITSGGEFRLNQTVANLPTYVSRDVTLDIDATYRIADLARLDPVQYGDRVWLSLEIGGVPVFTSDDVTDITGVRTQISDTFVSTGTTGTIKLNLASSQANSRGWHDNVSIRKVL